MLNSVEESFQKDIILLLIRVLQLVRRLKCLHKFTELFLVDAVVSRELLQVLDQRFVEASLRLLVVFAFDWPLKKILHKFSHCWHWDVVVRAEVEEQRSENLLQQ